MPINVSEALDSDTCVKVTVKRTASSGFVGGLFVKGETSNFKTLCSPQQPTPQELQTLPEGERNKDVYRFITKKPVRMTSDRDEIIADEIYFKGNWYKIISLGDWDIFGQTTSFGARVQ